ncbi:hypothetical protein F9C07_2159054 [Aspergillus flavus]|uniref:Uncharacterized protein n=1 Tax=Aspergillus flavus (strain ATCC 200026 / FGSC A1120 / IAM 13836 / NRRL 3357 / JCM 12722 / SRRC 167) TaxID=332952 RepID=A0A7U2MVE7_ASPFN|nr:hypothetical protein F9C07_2159054 [Aspergillus flavus]
MHITLTQSNPSGRLWDIQHGVEGEVEAGKGQITRYSNGQPTRFTFKKRFQRTPNVQITPILTNRHGTFNPFYLYLMSPSGGPPADEDGFYLGIYSKPGVSMDFEYFATGIYDGED